jgi:hypothetical protein
MPTRSDPSHHPDYGRLTAYLRGCQQPRITLTFTQLEQEILLGMLPWAARVYSVWWTNVVPIVSSRPQTHAWLDAGWRVAAADQAAGTVVFERGGQEQEEL